MKKLKKLNKLIDLPKTEFDLYLKTQEPNKEPLIQVRPSRLIPLLKAGDEMALTSIFLSSLKLKSLEIAFLKKLNFQKEENLSIIQR